MTHYQLGKSETALSLLDDLIRQDSLHVWAHRSKGHILAGQGDHHAAAMSFETVIRHATKPIPENYLEASDAWINTQTSEGDMHAVEVIELGIRTLGPLMLFYQRLIDHSIDMQAYDRAIEYHTAVISIANRKEWAYHDRAQTFLLMGDLQSAYDDLIKARDAIGQLPERLQSQQNIAKLKAQIETQLNDLLNK